MKKYLILLLLVVSQYCFSQIKPEQKDSLTIRKFYDMALLNGKAYHWLEHISNDIGPRLSGSIGAQQAVDYTKQQLDSLGLDKVWLQPVMVPKWVRGAKEFAYIQTADATTRNINITALGGSVATPSGGIRANVVEVQGLEDLARYGKDNLQGKIVFFNRPMRADYINTFDAYRDAVDQRTRGAAEAAKYGAVGVLVRSLNLKLDDSPHAGNMHYQDSEKIPAAAISTNDAEYLSSLLKIAPEAQVYFKINSKQLADVESYNVIGQITGSEYPEDFIVVGGHLDSWDLGTGAQDDGAGVTQSMEVLRLFKELGLKPKHSIRVVLFMNEENGVRGGKKYAQAAEEKKETHLFALESDNGGFTPRGFSIDASAEKFQKIESWKPLFQPYLVHYFRNGGSGSDVTPLKDETNITAELITDSQRYFDYHHSENDTFDKVNQRELELGAATMASLIYLIDQYGI
ncbi:MAG: M20/M25/M40 family metallo-hydrolase [Gillisia sp.]